MAGPHSRFLGAQQSLATGARSGKLDGHIPRDGPGAASLDSICLLKVHLKLERQGARQKALGIQGLLSQAGCPQEQPIWRSIWSGLNSVTEGRWDYWTRGWSPTPVLLAHPSFPERLICRSNKEGKGNKHVLCTWAVQAFC